MERQRDVSRSASGVDRKHKRQKVMGRGVRVLGEQTQPPAEDDFLADVNGGILDLRPTSHPGKRWNLSCREVPREILWLIRKKRLKLVIGYGRCILFCTVLYMSRSGEEPGSCTISVATHRSSLSLLRMTRMECRHDVFHALGDVRDRRDGARVSVLTNSPHIARRVEGSKR